ncbi:MAG: hypothetical protein J6J64_00145 [Alistipes sp.]|nr:hypothetical protein [Alistipes sp.]
MIGRVKHIAMMMLSVLALVSCDRTIHEYPGEPNIELIVSCSVDLTHPEHFVTVECDAETGTTYIVRTQNAELKGTRFNEPVCLRYVIDLYRVASSHSVFVERRVCYSSLTDPKIEATTMFNVDAAKYKVLIWCDYVQDDVREAWYYQTDDLTKILYSDIEVVDNNDKDVFSNMIDVDLTDYYYLDGDFIVSYDTELTRPKGRFKCITTDDGDFEHGGGVAEDITAVITYTQYVSAGYNVEEQKPNYFEPTRTFITKAKRDKDGALELFYDYVFVNGKQTNVKLNMFFYNGDISIGEGGEIIGEEISHWTSIVVPLKRNMETIIEGRMLTTSFGTGGIGIDPGFDDEIVVEWPD